MTCIVAYKDENNIYMAGDTLASSCRSKHRVTEPKVMQKVVSLSKNSTDYEPNTKEDMLLGYTTSFRMGQLLTHHFVPPQYHREETPMQYMVKRFVPAIIELYDNNHYANKDDANKMNGGQFLIGFLGEIFAIQNDYSIVDINDHPFNSCGSGRDFALGSMYAAEKLGCTDPMTIVKNAIRCASEFVPTVNDKIDVLTINS